MAPGATWKRQALRGTRHGGCSQLWHLRTLLSAASPQLGQPERIKLPCAGFGKKRGQGVVGHREFGSDPLRLDARETWDDGQDETWGFRGKVGPRGRGGSGSHEDTAGLRLGESPRGGGGSSDQRTRQGRAEGAGPVCRHGDPTALSPSVGEDRLEVKGMTLGESEPLLAIYRSPQ